MKVALPVTVMLRNRVNAMVESVAQGLPPFVLQGRSINGAELWRRDGRWREDGARSPYDLVAVYADGVPQPLTNQFEK